MKSWCFLVRGVNTHMPTQAETCARKSSVKMRKFRASANANAKLRAEAKINTEANKKRKHTHARTHTHKHTNTNKTDHRAQQKQPSFSVVFQLVVPFRRPESTDRQANARCTTDAETGYVGPVGKRQRHARERATQRGK